MASAPGIAHLPLATGSEEPSRSLSLAPPSIRWRTYARDQVGGSYPDTLARASRRTGPTGSSVTQGTIATLVECRLCTS